MNSCLAKVSQVNEHADVELLTVRDAAKLIDANWSVYVCVLMEEVDETMAAWKVMTVARTEMPVNSIAVDIASAAAVVAAAAGVAVA